MAIYVCNGVRGVIGRHAQAEVARELTEIHCGMTGALPQHVHVFFFEDAPQLPINGKSIFLFGSICTGLTHAQKTELATRMKVAIFTRAGVPLGEITVNTTDVPASWVMVGGNVQTGPERDATCVY